MTTFSRTDTSVMGRWWWTVDRWSLAAVVALMAFGTMLALASSPAVAERIGVDSLYFVKRHLVFLPVAAAVIITTSLMTPLQVRRLALIAFAACLVGLGATLLFGVEINGARRWLTFAGLSVQERDAHVHLLGSGIGHHEHGQAVLETVAVDVHVTHRERRLQLLRTDRGCEEHGDDGHSRTHGARDSTRVARRVPTGYRRAG